MRVFDHIRPKFATPLAMGIEAARREARFKNWCRKWKLNLIEGFNPTWRDLYEEICS